MYRTGIKLSGNDKDALFDKIIDIVIDFSNARDIPDTYHYRAEWIGYNITKELYRAGLIKPFDKPGDEQMKMEDAVQALKGGEG